MQDVYAAAGLPVPMAPFADQLPLDVDLMTGAQREAVLAVVRGGSDPVTEPEPEAESSSAPTPTEEPDPEGLTEEQLVAYF